MRGALAVSISAMNAVWNSGLAGSDLVYALALADHAHDDGTSIKPGTRRIRNKTKLSRATVQRKRAKAEKAGWLKLVEKRSGRPWLYKMIFEKLPPFVEIDDGPDRGPQNEAGQEDDSDEMRRGVPHLDEAGGASPGEALTTNNVNNLLPLTDARQRAEGARASDVVRGAQGSAMDRDPAMSCDLVDADAVEKWAALRARMEAKFGSASFGAGPESWSWSASTTTRS